MISDGFVQLSFTIPMALGPKTKMAVHCLAEKMNLQEIKIIHLEQIDTEKTFCILQGVCEAEVDVEKITENPEPELVYDFQHINGYIQEKIKRQIVVMGASLGRDSMPVFLDTLFNVSGYMGQAGLETYPQFKAINYRADLDMPMLAKKIADLQSDAILVSKVSTRRDDPVIDLRKFLRELEKTPGVPQHLVKICIGPRLNEQKAKDMGFDMGFGPGTVPNQVAGFIAQEMGKRLAL